MPAKKSKTRTKRAVSSKSSRKQGFSRFSFSKKHLLLFALIFAAIGGYGVWRALAAGTTIVVNSGSWICDRPLSSYGELPITVEHTIQNGSSQQNGAVRLMDSCTAQNSGGRDGKIDLILHINGNGSSTGSSNDGMALIGAHDMDITGWVNCGGIASGAHQDGVQMNRAHRINFINFSSGNWNTQTATCHGAGGIFYVSELNDNASNLTDVVCDGCRLVGTKPGGGPAGTALYLGGSTRSGAQNSCFSANRPLITDQHRVNAIDQNNLYIDRDAGGSQPSPAACRASASPPPPAPPPPPTPPTPPTPPPPPPPPPPPAPTPPPTPNPPTPPPSGSTSSPSTPTNLHVTKKTRSSISIKWDASTATGAFVSSYKVYRNDKLIAKVPSTRYTDRGLNARTSYTYRVSAVDNAGNESAKSSPITVKTKWWWIFN